MAKKSKKQPGSGSSTIALNKKAKHEYFIQERYEAGISLQGWEVKSLREGRVQLTDSYVFLRNGEAALIGTNITPLLSASTHIKPEPMRTRKLLLHRQELDKLIGMVDRKGYTLVPLALYWKKGKVKLEIGLAKGKQLHDKRETEKNRDWDRDKQRILKAR
ncbi:SsrA-binding protein SmpB [Sedimenticola thiotaurini]|uniref:SsrA-binding protein n=1 Tax=Sedimenticola thiotaurini TaxID=1543721 RepID=A0A0F7JWY2_9GAMM|nr:SsrA-binding protein SmpB [Sedimenticola thiotaurini]AKH19889.1 SsrA-binding protein [Sedimenticola thiotaurini]